MRPREQEINLLISASNERAAAAGCQSVCLLKSPCQRIDNDGAGTVEVPRVARNNGRVVNKCDRGDQGIGLVATVQDIKIPHSHQMLR